MHYLFKFIVHLITIASLGSFFSSFSKSQSVNRLSGSSARDLQISVTNSFGVRTNVDTNSNVKTINSATVNLLPGSQIDDAFGDSKGNASANFTISPSGGNMSINGIQSRNIFLFGSGTQFNSQMESIENPDTSKRVEGNASSMAVHEFGVNVRSQQSQFNSSFSQNF